MGENGQPKPITEINAILVAWGTPRAWYEKSFNETAAAPRLIASLPDGIRGYGRFGEGSPRTSRAVARPVR